MAIESFMRTAIGAAEESLREGNKGFGAVVVRGGEVLAVAHDREGSDRDPASHAEINAIRAACARVGKNLSGCLLVSTHEPCPMCAFAIVWSGLAEVAFGYGIHDAMAQGRRRIDFPCTEAFARAGAPVKVHQGVLGKECAVLYRADVRQEIERLRHAGDAELAALCADSTARRTAWFERNRRSLPIRAEAPLDSAHRVLACRFGADPEEMPVISRTATSITFHSRNFCPSLEACKILRLDTRSVCRRLNEASTDALVKQVDARLRFSRNYDTLRPYAGFCEESIAFEHED